MQRQPVNSSSIRSIGYRDKVLEVEFAESGGVYQYFPVPPAVFRRLLAAPSKGRFVNYEVKERFSYRKVR